MVTLWRLRCSRPLTLSLMLARMRLRLRGVGPEPVAISAEVAVLSGVVWVALPVA
jgi:hypothetical protein